MLKYRYLKSESKIEQFCQCGEELKIRKFIKPEFGFSTNVDTPKVTGDNKPKKYYASRVTFEDFERLDIYQEKEVMQNLQVITSPLVHTYN